jgi:hypothetical protein
MVTIHVILLRVVLCFLVMRDKDVAAYRKHPVMWCFISTGFLCVPYAVSMCQLLLLM